jgi:hypothetical protein
MQRTSVRHFAAEEKPKDEAAAARAEWGIKYDDECLKFEKEWEIIAKKVDTQQAVFIESELGDIQKAKVDMLADKVLSLNLFEMRYFQIKIK